MTPVNNTDEEIDIRLASPDDAEELLAIYAPYVSGTAVSFECSVPTAEMFRSRIENTLKEYPYLVAEVNGGLRGYAYAGAFRTREAYRHSAETSIYVDKNEHGKGIGRALYEALEELLKKQNVYVFYACATCTDREDEFLPKTSLLFHEHMGYRKVGAFENCGYKFGRWYGTRWLEKIIAERPVCPEPFIPFPELNIYNI